MLLGEADELSGWGFEGALDINSKPIISLIFKYLKSQLLRKPRLPDPLDEVRPLKLGESQGV